VTIVDVHRGKTRSQILPDLEKICFYTLIFSSSPADMTVLKK
jgi:hypothetical protein